LRILFDAFWWATGPYSNRQVLREFIFSWERLFPLDQLTVVVQASALEKARRELPARVDVVISRLRPQGVSAIIELPFIARRLGADITITHNFSPLFTPSAVFVHDLMFTTNPEWFTAIERAYFSLMTMTLRRADVVVTSSRAEAARIDRVGTARSAAISVGLGFPGSLVDAVPVAPQDVYGLAGFMLIVGRLNVRKNLSVALQAAVGSGAVDAEHPIIVVGEPSGKAADLPIDVAEAVSAGWVKFTGFISDSELAWLYSNASLFLFLSLDEGFGIPTLEALHFGAPILASDIAVFREILGERATFVDPLSTNDIASAIHTLLSDSEPSRPEPVSAAQLGYSWDSSVTRFRAAVVASGAVTLEHQ
jgi:glycosyltransferase involved in cell wall biosynthesis